MTRKKLAARRAEFKTQRRIRVADGIPRPVAYVGL